MTNHEYRVESPYVVLSFLLLLFCVLCGVIVNSVLKSRCSIISASGFRKRQKQRVHDRFGGMQDVAILSGDSRDAR